MGLKRFIKFVLFVIILCSFLSTQNNLQNINNSKSYKFIGKSNRTYSHFILKENFHENHNWMFNYNIMQYSSYIIVKNEDIKQIESMVYVESNKLESENLKCLLISTLSYKVFILEHCNFFKTKQFDVRKVVCTIENNWNCCYKYK